VSGRAGLTGFIVLFDKGAGESYAELCIYQAGAASAFKAAMQSIPVIGLRIGMLRPRSKRRCLDPGTQRRPARWPWAWRAWVNANACTPGHGG
jgi:hypothetical protein